MMIITVAHVACKVWFLANTIYWVHWSLYRGGQTIFAILVMMGTRHACNIDDKRDQICLPYQFCLGPGMPAIFSHKDYVCLPYFQNFKSISCKARSLPVKSDWRKWCAIKRRILWSNRIRPVMTVFYRKFIFNFENMARIPGPKQNWYDKHVWSSLLSRWQACLVPIRVKRTRLSAVCLCLWNVCYFMN